MFPLLDELLNNELMAKGYSLKESVEISDSLMQLYKSKHLKDYGQNREWFNKRAHTLLRYVHLYYSRMK